MLLRRTVLLLLITLIFAFVSLFTQDEVKGQHENAFRNKSADSAQSLIYLPVALANSPYRSPFGAESNKAWIAGSNIYQKGVELNLKWARLGGRISWRELQPNEGDPIDWTKLVDFEKEIKSLKTAGFTPVIIISDSPYWATRSETSCAAIREDKFPAFESFIRSVVDRYKTPKFNIHNWEIGNEPDVDPTLVPKDSVFGCWGRINDKYYGGEHYGKMLIQITPAIKQVDPAARVWFGGLLLSSPDTTDPNLGKPEMFLKGALEAGAGSFFDVLAYHWYPPYLNERVDHDLQGQWKEWGGGTIGKAQFLRGIMQEYGVDKPLFLNETSLMCPPTIAGQQTYYCNPPTGAFFQMQADHGVRSFVRGLSINLAGFSWYTLNGPGWRNTGLLDEQGNPRPSYKAYKHLIAELEKTRYLGQVDYGDGVDGYAFNRGKEIVDVIWTLEDVNIPVSIPQAKFVAAYDRDGAQLTPTLVGNTYKLNAGFSPLYIIRKP